MFTERTNEDLDVHARSVVAVAIDGETGELTQQVELLKVDLQMLEGLDAERHHPCFVAFTGQRHMPRVGQGEVLQCQGGDFPDPGSGLIQQDQQYPVPS